MYGAAPVLQGFGALPGWHPQLQLAAGQPMTLPPITEQTPASQSQPGMQFAPAQVSTVRVTALSDLSYTLWGGKKLHQFFAITLSNLYLFE